MSGIFKKFRQGDIEITPYEAHKSYYIEFINCTGSYFEENYQQSVIKNHIITSSTPMWIGEVSLSAFAYSASFDSTQFTGDEIGRHSNLISASSHARTTNGFYKRSLFDSVSKMYYTNPENPFWTLHVTSQEKEIRNLDSTCQILSIPQNMFGSAIKTGSFQISHSGINIQDDGYGNLIDSDITTYDFEANRIYYQNFSGMHAVAGENKVLPEVHSKIELRRSDERQKGIKERKDRFTNFFELSKKYDNYVEGYNIRPVVVPNEGSVIKFGNNNPNTGSLETRKEIKNQQVIRVKHAQQFDFKCSDNWTLVCRVSCSKGNQEATANYVQDVISGSVTTQTGNSRFTQPMTILGKFDTTRTAAFPFHIYTDSNVDSNLGGDQIGVTSFDGFNQQSLFLSGSLPAGYNWISVTMNDGVLSGKLNNTQMATGSNGGTPLIFPSSSDFNNTGDITIGTRAIWNNTYQKTDDALYNERYSAAPTYQNGFTGGIANIQMFNKALTAGELASITSSNASNAGVVGNIFYKHGLAVITSENAKYNSILTNCSVSFDNTHTIIEHEYACHIKEREFLYTMNPTIIDDRKTNTIKHFVSRSEWSPYITTIGLYDDHLRLLAVGKLSRAIKKSSDYDTSFIVRFDS